MKRLNQIVLVGSFLGFCWLGMQVVHEFGHCLGAWATGGKIGFVVAHPLTISCTILTHNPHPLVVVWAGPLVGSVLPLVAFLLATVGRVPGLYLFRFFAGFCLVANGAYIGVGSFDRFLDAGDMMTYGSPQWSLIVFGLTAAAAGLWLWNGLGPHFGLGEAGGAVSRKAAVCSLCLFVLLAGIEMIIGSK